jgi:hypothetical protein
MFSPLTDSGDYDVECLTPNWCEALTMYVDEMVRQCVLFLGSRDDKSGRFIPRATAFVVSIMEADVGFRYVVTAEHSISWFRQKNWDLYVRSNLKDGGVSEDNWTKGHWYFHPDAGSTDVAVAPIDFKPWEEFKQIVLRSPPPDRGIPATAEIMRANKIGLGDEVFIVGLFRSHYGQQRNIPIIRVGNIAMLKGEPVFAYYCGHTDAYLIEARSIGGLSGSPVFVHTPVAHELNVTQFRLLGLMHGHFDVQNLHEDTVAEAEGVAGINSGVGVVIPVEKILETLDQPELVEMRKKAGEALRKSRGATADFGEDDSTPPPSTDANPTHREDFTRLVGEAARKREPKD